LPFSRILYPNFDITHYLKFDKAGMKPFTKKKPPIAISGVSSFT